MAKHRDHPKSPPAEAGIDKKPAQPTPEDQSGSTGRRTEDAGKGPDKNSGQDQYGQSGSGSKVPAETDGQRRYREGRRS